MKDSITAIELRDILANQIKILNELDPSDRLARNKIDTAKQVFNGGGKIISLAVYVSDVTRSGQSKESLLRIAKE